MAFIHYYKTITWFGALLPLLLCGSPVGTTPFQYCTNYLGEEIEDGVQFIPNADDLCYRCTCDGGYPVACSSVFCSPPDCKLYEVVEDECCKFICLEAADEPDVININDTGEPVLPKDGLEYLDSANLPLRLVASTVTSFLILALLLFMVHRLRQRRTLIMLRRLNAERQEEDTVAYLPQMDNLDIGIEFPPYEDPPPPYTPPKPPYIPEGEAPPPYDEPNGHIITADNHRAQSDWVEGDVRQCNDQGTQASNQSAPTGMRKDEAVQANHLSHDDGLDKDLQGMSECAVSCTLNAFHSCGTNTAHGRGRHQSCLVSSSGEQTCVSTATVYTTPSLAAASASHRLEMNHLESLGNQHANCLLSDGMADRSERCSDTNSSCKPVYLSSGAPCCIASTRNDSTQPHTEAFSESDDRCEFHSSRHNSPDLLKQACMNGKQLTVEIDNKTTSSMYPHHWNDGIHCAGTNNASAWNTSQEHQRNSRAGHLASSAEKHLASQPANQCSNEHTNLQNSQPSFPHTSCSASYLSHIPDGMNSSPCCHSINTNASSAPSREPAVNHSLVQATTPGHHMVSRSGSVTSQASLLSVCSETGERKRPPLSLPCQILGPDVRYPDNSPLSHLTTREDPHDEVSVHCRYLGISDPAFESNAADNITVKNTRESADVNRDYSNLSHAESASDGMPLEHIDLQHIGDDPELTADYSTSSMQGMVLPHSHLAEPSFSPNPGLDHQSRTKKRQTAGFPSSGDQSKSCSGDANAVNDITQHEMPQFKQYGFIDDPEVLMAFKDNTVYPEAGDKVLSAVLFEKLCSQSQSSERPAYNSPDQNSSGYSSKSLTNDRSDDSSVEQSRSREHTPHGLCEPNENIDNRPKLESSKVNFMYWCMNKTNEQGKARTAKHRKRHKACNRQCKSKSRSTETPQHSKYLADKDTKDILNNNKLDNYAALSMVSVSTSTEKIPDDEVDNLSNQIIDPERCISSDPDYSDR